MKNENRNIEILECSDNSKEVYIETGSFPELEYAGISMAGLSYLKEHFHLRRTLHQHHMLVLSLAGEAIFKTDKDEGILQGKAALFIPLGTPFEYKLIPSSGPWNLCWFMLKPVSAWAAFPAVFEHRQGLPLEGTENCFRLLKAEEFADENSPLRVHLTACLTEYIHRVIRSVNSEFQEPRLKQLLTAINRDLEHPWNLPDMCKVAALSKTHLQRLCKEHYHCTPVQLLQKQRLKHAGLMLKATSLSIKNISQASGFKDPYHFSNAFKKHFGMSPTDYRTRHQTV